MSDTKLLAVGVKKGRLKSHLVCCVIWFEDTLDKTIDKASKILGVKPQWIGICLPLTSEDLESLKKKILQASQ